jgi:hypothetical protein
MTKTKFERKNTPAAIINGIVSTPVTFRVIKAINTSTRLKMINFKAVHNGVFRRSRNLFAKGYQPQNAMNRREENLEGRIRSARVEDTIHTLIPARVPNSTIMSVTSIPHIAETE